MRKINHHTKGTLDNNSSIIGEAIIHDSAIKHVSGCAKYVDDISEQEGLLHVATGFSTQAHAKIKNIDLSKVRNAKDVIDVIISSDIPGLNDIAPVFDGDPLLADQTVNFYGQIIFAVAALSYKAAHKAVALAVVEYENLEPIIDIAESKKKNSYLMPPKIFKSGDAKNSIKKSANILESELQIPSQEHFYLESQVALAVPSEDSITIHSSSQHPSEIQKLVSEVLDLPLHSIQTEVRRMGGAFGGKESQAAITACIAALFAMRCNRPVKHRMNRRDDIIQTGKRHPFLSSYKVGFDGNGKIEAVDIDLYADCGCSMDLSIGIVQRAMFHADNAYQYPNVQIKGHFCKTNKASNTAFRGFGGPQGMLACESMIDDIARKIGLDPLIVRKKNLYKQGDTTPYGQEVDENILLPLIEKLEDQSDYWLRRREITEFNQTNEYLKKGIALTPVKFGISFTSKHLNQAGALVHIYTDGSILLNHGGTEMGQGLFIKVQQVVANAFGVSIERVKSSATRTDKVPNTSPTAASSGSDMNGMAALDACNQIKKRLVNFAVSHFNIDESSIYFKNNHIMAGKEKIPFEDFINLAYLNRIQLSSTGYYKTPKIWFDPDTGKGRPFYYFANGAACSEVTIDITTGQYRVNQVDILHDTGKSLNPGIDIGQIEGGFIQGMGWLTTEDLNWDEKGKINCQGPATYKIPTAFDTPSIFNVELYNQDNTEETIHKSKAVGEPPFMLAISTWCAIRDACSSLSNYQYSPSLPAPATNESVFFAAEDALKNKMTS